MHEFLRFGCGHRRCCLARLRAEGRFARAWSAKHLRIREFKKFRTDTVRLGAIVPPTPLLRAIRLNADGAKLVWLAEPGSRYRVQCKFSLSQSEWTDLAVEVTADGPLASTSVPAANAQCFYRVVVVP